MNPTVVALVVSHDGSRWLPAVIDGLHSQTVPLSGVVCVDTGSRDESADLVYAVKIRVPQRDVSEL